MVYRTVKNNKIIHVCETNSEENVIKSMAYEGIADYDQIEAVPNDYFQGKVGNDIREFDSNYEFLPLSQRKDYVTIPEGMKIEGEEFVPMTVKEKIDAGLITLSDHEIWDEELKEIRSKTIYELAEANIITISELKSYQKKLISQSRDEAIEQGHFMSASLGIEVDCRRSMTKNDKQNVEGLLSYMERNSLTTIEYIGYDQGINTTKVKLQALVYEMEDHVLGFYQKKTILHSQIDSATTVEQIKSIKW